MSSLENEQMGGGVKPFQINSGTVVFVFSTLVFPDWEINVEDITSVKDVTIVEIKCLLVIPWEKNRTKFWKSLFWSNYENQMTTHSQPAVLVLQAIPLPIQSNTFSSCVLHHVAGQLDFVSDWLTGWCAIRCLVTFRDHVDRFSPRQSVPSLARQRFPMVHLLLL